MALLFGVDEVGRGPLAGPVVAAAVAWIAPVAGVRDSKTLSARARERLDGRIRATLPVALGEASVAEIDSLNILNAALLAMQRAIEALAAVAGPPDLVLVDGNRAPACAFAVRTVVGGDSCEPAIAAASIIAKVARDSAMRALDAADPRYGFGQHMGYPTAAHLAALARFGPGPHHRHSFAPVRDLGRNRPGG
jgi:ribonuclease HII